MKNKPDAAHIEREIGHNTAVALAQQITKLEDQLAAERERHATENDAHYGYVQLAEQQLAAERAIKSAEKRILLDEVAKNKTLVDALKRLRYCRCNDVVSGKHNPACNVAIIDAALAKVEDQPVQLPMINDDPVVTLK